MKLGKKKLKTFQQKPVEGGLVWQRGVRRGSTASSLSESFDGEVYELGLECCATSSFTWATVAAETRHLNFLLAERALDWNSTAVGTGAAVKRRLENLKTVAAKMIVKCEMLAHWARFIGSCQLTEMGRTGMTSRMWVLAGVGLVPMAPNTS